jgi:hypothetical protein
MSPIAPMRHCFDFLSRRFKAAPIHKAQHRARAMRAEQLEPRHLLAAHPILSEFMASNGDSLRDGDGNASDWIEIYNPNPTPIDLAGYHLSDSANNLTKWAFPSVTIAPGGFVVVFASNQPTSDYVDGAGYLHTNFALSAATARHRLRHRTTVDAHDARWTGGRG